MAKLPHKFTLPRKSASLRIREALIELQSIGAPFDLKSDGVHLRYPRFIFAFQEAFLSKNKIRKFKEWLSFAKTEDDFKKLPVGIIPREIRRRDWSAVPGASIGRLAPAPKRQQTVSSAPTAPSSTLSAPNFLWGSHSTVPGHLTALNWYDLQPR